MARNLIIRVEAEHLKNGLQKNCCYCPVALSLGRYIRPQYAAWVTMLTVSAAKRRPNGIEPVAFHCSRAVLSNGSDTIALIKEFDSLQRRVPLEPREVSFEIIAEDVYAETFYQIT